MPLRSASMGPRSAATWAEFSADADPSADAEAPAAGIEPASPSTPAGEPVPAVEAEPVPSAALVPVDPVVGAAAGEPARPTPGSDPDSVAAAAGSKGKLATVGVDWTMCPEPAHPVATATRTAAPAAITRILMT